MFLTLCCGLKLLVAYVKLPPCISYCFRLVFYLVDAICAMRRED